MCYHIINNVLAACSIMLLWGGAVARKMMSRQDIIDNN